MTRSALQQSTQYTGVLCAMGVSAHCDATSGVHWVTRGPFTAATRLGADVDFAKIRQNAGRRICLLSPDVGPGSSLHKAGFRRIMTPATVAEIDLRSHIKQHVKWRNALHSAQRGPLATCHRPFSNTKDQWLLNADLVQQKSRKFKALPHDVIRRWPTKSAHVSIAYLNNTPVAGMIFLQHGKTVTYQLGWTDTVGRTHNAHQLLLHGAIENFTKRNLSWLDMGTVDSVNNPGLTRFKVRAGATLRPLGGTWAAWPKWRS
jgi:hypothetical protein